MSNTWTIGDIAKLNPTGTKEARSQLDAEVVFLPMAAVKEDGTYDGGARRTVATVRTGFTYFERGDILLAKITPCMENGKATIVTNLATPFGFGSTEFHVLRANPGIDPRYVFYAVWNDRFRKSGAASMQGAAGQQRISTSFVEKYAFRAIAPGETSGIANLLDLADGIRRKRREALRLADELVRSTFLEMFGDPVGNPRGWPKKSVGSVCATRQYGTADKANTDRRGIPVLRMGNLTNDGRIDMTDLKWVELSPRELEQLDLQDGDVLFNRTNSLELVGKTAVWHRSEQATFAGYLVRLRLDPAQAHPDYVAAALNLPSGKSLLKSVAKPSINMANISASDLDRVEIAFPPPDLQEAFAVKVARSGLARARLEAAAREAETLFTSLQNQAFGAESSCP